MSFLLASALVSNFFFGLIFVGGLQQLARKKLPLVVPNHRSSHELPTPTGGGIGIIVCMLMTVFYLYMGSRLSGTITLGLLLPAFIASAMGFMADIHQGSIRMRIAVQLLAGALLVAVGDVNPLHFSTYPWLLAFSPIIVLAFIWFVNLFNFMDGIDGLAGMETVTVAVIAALIIAMIGSPGWEAWVAILLSVAGAALGFLCWNFAPAKIFLGDVGSNFLGAFFIAIVLLTATENILSLWSWIILFAVFWVDATITLIVRILGGNPWHEAHRSHCYQILSRRFRSHARVVLLIGLVNICWLAPLAMLAELKPGLSIYCTLVAIAPLIWFCWRSGAGRLN